MAHVYLRRICWFIGLVLLQVLVLNHIHVGGYATPFLYVYFILKMSTGTSRNELMLWAFFLGLLIDVFSCTPGMNAAASVWLAFVRPSVFRLFSSRDIQDAVRPSIAAIGVGAFVKYVVACVLIHHTALMIIEAFSFLDIPVMLLKVVTSTLFTVLCILCVDGIKR